MTPQQHSLPARGKGGPSASPRRGRWGRCTQVSHCTPADLNIAACDAMPARLPRQVVTLQVRPSATAQGSCAEPRPQQSSRSHDDVEHDAGHKSRVDDAHDVAERQLSLMDPKPASWKDERGEKKT
jgi:hypothetical protein